MWLCLCLDSSMCWSWCMDLSKTDKSRSLLESLPQPMMHRLRHKSLIRTDNFSGLRILYDEFSIGCWQGWLLLYCAIISPYFFKCITGNQICTYTISLVPSFGWFIALLVCYFIVFLSFALELFTWFVSSIPSNFDTCWNMFDKQAVHFRCRILWDKGLQN